MLSSLFQPSTGWCLNGRLIHVNVSGSKTVENVIKDFLVEQNYIPTDDAAVAQLKVKAAERHKGPPHNQTVVYYIDYMELILPDVGTIYSSSKIRKAQGQGKTENAEAGARSLLKSYLDEDNTFKDKLRSLPNQTYYQIMRLGTGGETRLAAIERQVRNLAEKMPNGREVLGRLDALEAQHSRFMAQTVYSRASKDLSVAVEFGEGLVSEAALEHLVLLAERSVFLAQRSIRAQKIIHRLDLIRCRAEEQQKYTSIAAVFIRVPVADPAELGGGMYSIYDDKHYLIYEMEADKDGPATAASLRQLQQMSGTGKFFKSKEYYLELRAKAYDHADRAVILRFCDADALVYASIRGMEPDRIFEKGRIYLVPLIE